MSKNYIWKPCTCIFKNGKSLEYIIDDSLITCREITDTMQSTKTMSINFNNKKATYKMNNFYILLAVLIRMILLSIIVGIQHHNYHIKH